MFFLVALKPTRFQCMSKSLKPATFQRFLEHVETDQNSTNFKTFEANLVSIFFRKRCYWPVFNVFQNCWGQPRLNVFWNMAKLNRFQGISKTLEATRFQRILENVENGLDFKVCKTRWHFETRRVSTVSRKHWNRPDFNLSQKRLNQLRFNVFLKSLEPTRVLCMSKTLKLIVW